MTTLSFALAIALGTLAADAVRWAVLAVRWRWSVRFQQWRIARNVEKNYRRICQESNR